MKILLIGHSIIDHFEEFGNELTRPGGIFYSLLGIFSIAEADNEIFLLTGLNQNRNHLFENLYSKANLTMSNDIEEMPEVVLLTSGKGERKETYKNLSSQLSIEKIGDWNQFDGILINMITGFDISLDQLKTIRKNFNGTIYFDVHTLSRGVNFNLQREFRPIPKIEEWLSNIDILQCNENELKTIVQSKTESESAAEIIRSGVKTVIITKGNKGAHLYSNSGGEIKSHFVKAVKIHTVNKVGCGDIFGAVFFYSYISTRDLYKSLELANKAGATASSLKDITSLTMIKLND